MDELNKPYNHKDHEEKIYKKWEESGSFNPDNLPGERKETFCMTMAPPNVTGSLHMGHALEYTLSDILIRFKRMSGYETLWLPGTDHAGIATQNVVEKELKKQGLTRHDLGREKFLEKVWEWKEKYGHTIIDQLKKLGSSADWSRTRFTMDTEYAGAVANAFKHYYDKGLVYQGERVINWCSRCETSLSDLETEYQEEESELVFIKYPLVEKSEIRNPKSETNSEPKNQGSEFIIVATTRTETMLGDSAVAVNPKDERYKKFVGKKVILPIQNREIPIIADDAVDMGFGTGAVKVTPSHDASDFEIHERHNLPIYKVIDEKGRMADEAGADFKGMKVLECRAAVVKKLEKLGLIEKTEKFTHNISKCYRCGTVIEPLISKQWFVKMKTLAQKAIDAVESGHVKFHPENFKKTYLDWLKNIKDWCVSRQIWWGHRLPVFYCTKKQEAISNFQFLISNDKEVIIGEKPEKCPTCKNCKMKQIDDVLDTWFSSALWPFTTLGWPHSAKASRGKPSDLERFYPTNVLTNDRGIINLWDARMVFSGLEFIGKQPFSDLIIHATVLTKEGKRMSKSLGTGIDPLQLIDQYGADATRFALIWQSMGGQDIKWQQEAVVAGKKLLNKIWNAGRFVLRQLNADRYSLIAPDVKENINKEILKKLEKIKSETTESIKKYEFGQALHALYDFFWHDFCDKYLEESKKSRSDETNQTLVFILASTIKLFHPFIPFVTEALWDKIPIKGKKLLMIENW